jgi:NAD(P)-dependent dehydrogenase (short-subunit alcohol dehydrogenase family)
MNILFLTMVSSHNPYKAANPTAKVSCMQLDLASLLSIQKFAEEVNALNKPVHILINNAGIMGCPYATTEDGFESQIGTNHLGHFQLTKLLLPLLSKSGSTEVPARVVNLSSLANYVFPPAQGIDFDNIDGKKYYDAYVRYGESKLANILFTKELQRRLEADHQNVITVSLHPGVILGTNLIRHLSVSIAWNATCSILTSGSAGSLSALIREPQKSIPQGSATTVRAALDPKIIPGEHYADCNVSNLVHPEGLNAELQKKFWDLSEQLIAEALSKE